MSLARDGYRSRVSDLLNASERDFLVLTDTTVEPLDGGPSERHAFVAVARRHIVFAVTESEDRPARGGGTPGRGAVGRADQHAWPLLSGSGAGSGTPAAA